MTEWILETISQGGYLGIALLMVIENVFPPIPSEVIMGLGGINVARGQMELLPLLAAGTIGSTAGNYLWFMAGHRLGYERLKPFIDRWGRWLTLEWHDVERASDFMRRRGHWVVFALRFSPFFRTIISLPAGLVRMSSWKFVIYTAAGGIIWNSVLIGAGYYLGKNFAQLERYTGPVAIGMIGVMVAAYLWRVFTWKPRAQS